MLSKEAGHALYDQLAPEGLQTWLSAHLSPGGTIACLGRPFTTALEPDSHRPHESSTCPILRANSAISGFDAIPVRNIAEAA